MLFFCEMFVVCMELCLSVDGCDGNVEGRRLGCLCRGCVTVDVFPSACNSVGRLVSL